MNKYYYSICKECEYLYHCFGRETGEKILNDDIDDMYSHPESCKDFYPERKQ
jgi:hypothetical protein